VALTRFRLRWLLPVLVVVGVACMHTLGHPSGVDRHDGVGVARPVTQVAASLTHPQRPGPAVDWAVGRDAGPAQPDPGPPMDPLSICVATLAVALVLLAVALSWVARAGLGLRRTLINLAPAAAVRGPPGRLGLRLAYLSVQRI